jgi:multiple sugar transport system permease protein
MFPHPIGLASRQVQIAYRLALAGALVIWIAPLAAIALTALRPQEDLLAGNYWGLPSRFAFFDNYVAVFSDPRMLRFFVNSVVIAGVTVAGVVVLSTMAGFALAKYRFPGRTALLALFIGGNFVPSQVLMIPVRNLVVTLGMYDTIWAIVLFQTAFQTGFATLFLRNFIITLPRELFEAARIDGAGEWQVLFRIVIPLLRPALAGISVLIFTFVWNDYFWALALVQSDRQKPITLGLAGLRGEWLAAWNMLSAAALLAALPPVLLFFVAQRQFVAGLTSGAVKR